MKSKKSNLICIILAVILLFVGMCSQMGRTDSLVASFQNTLEADTIEDVENDTLYIGNCTSKLITGLRDTFRNLRRRGEGRTSLRNYSKFLIMEGISPILLSMILLIHVVCQQIPDGKIAILTYIHNQDGEK